MFAEAFLQALALLGTEIWVHHNTIGRPRVQFSFGGSVPSIGYILLCTRVDNGLF